MAGVDFMGKEIHSAEKILDMTGIHVHPSATFAPSMAASGALYLAVTYGAPIYAQYPIF